MGKHLPLRPACGIKRQPRAKNDTAEHDAGDRVRHKGDSPAAHRHDAEAEQDVEGERAGAGRSESGEPVMLLARDPPFFEKLCEVEGNFHRSAPPSPARLSSLGE